MLMDVNKYGDAVDNSIASKRTLAKTVFEVEMVEE